VGYGGLSTGAVARAAGVAQPTFYVHFRDMDDLLRTIGTEQIGRCGTGCAPRARR
jgi:AcrR family transcriptional regulator